MARLRVGTCSWKYPSWAGLVYSRAEGIDYLAEYARKYSTVEVDQWFWTLKPSPSDVERYRVAVPGDFRFTVKAPNALTLVRIAREEGSGAGSQPPVSLDRGSGGISSPRWSRCGRRWAW